MRRVWLVVLALASCDDGEKRVAPTYTLHVTKDDGTRHRLARDAFAAFASGARTFALPGIGDLRMQEVKGPFVVVEEDLDGFLSGGSTVPRIRMPWVATLLADLERGGIAFGVAGTFRARSQATILEEGELPPLRQPVRLHFTPSHQLRRRMGGDRAAVPTLSVAEVDAVLAAVPPPPRTLAEMDATFSAHGLDYALADLLPPSARREEYGGTVIGVRAGDPWILTDGHVDTLDSRGHFGPAFTEFAEDMVILAFVRRAAGAKQLDSAGMQRVLDRLGPWSEVWPESLPF